MAYAELPVEQLRVFSRVGGLSLVPHTHIERLNRRATYEVAVREAGRTEHGEEGGSVSLSPANL